MKYLLISLGVVLLIIFGIVIFNRGGTKTVTTTNSKKPITLLDYATNNNAVVQYSLEGPINAVEDHRTTQITISPTSRIVTVFKGYQFQALVSRTYPNDNNSYNEFLTALNRAGFTKEHKLEVAVSEASICPTASRTNYRLIDNGKDVMNLWSATCTTGSFGGSIPLTTTLFQTQIPNYGTVISSAH